MNDIEGGNLFYYDPEIPEGTRATALLIAEWREENALRVTYCPGRLADGSDWHFIVDVNG